MLATCPMPRSWCPSSYLPSTSCLYCVRSMLTSRHSHKSLSPPFQPMVSEKRRRADDFLYIVISITSSPVTLQRCSESLYKAKTERLEPGGKCGCRSESRTVSLTRSSLSDQQPTTAGVRFACV